MLTAHDPAHVRRVYSVGAGDRSLCGTSVDQHTDHGDVSVSEPGMAVPRAVWGPAAGVAVAHVPRLVSQVEVGGVDARRVVAGMAHVEAIRDFVDPRGVGGSGRNHPAAFDPELPIANGGSASLPLPAGPKLCNDSSFGPAHTAEPFVQRCLFGGSNCEERITMAGPPLVVHVAPSVAAVSFRALAPVDHTGRLGHVDTLQSCSAAPPDGCRRRGGLTCSILPEIRMILGVSGV